MTPYTAMLEHCFPTEYERDELPLDDVFCYFIIIVLEVVTIFAKQVLFVEKIKTNTNCEKDIQIDLSLPGKT